MNENNWDPVNPIWGNHDHLGRFREFVSVQQAREAEFLRLRLRD